MTGLPPNRHAAQNLLHIAMDKLVQQLPAVWSRNLYARCTSGEGGDAPTVALLDSSMLGCPNTKESMTMRPWTAYLSALICALLFLLSGEGGDVSAQPLNDYAATTEQSCSFGMDKGEPSQRCDVPFPKDCKVVNFPGTKKP